MQIQVNTNDIDDDDDDESDFTKRKIMKIKSLYQVTIYMTERKKPHSIYLLPTVDTQNAKTKKF